VEYLHGLSRAFIEKTITPKRWAAMDDADVIADLTRLRGIGVWTAEMFLIFHLHRPDILPLDDIGLQKAVAKHYADGKGLSAAKITTLAKKWQPYRSVATWYLWRSLDPVPVAY
jgi:DNA-3-methyladenine glycosylase II